MAACVRSDEKYSAPDSLCRRRLMPAVSMNSQSSPSTVDFINRVTVVPAKSLTTERSCANWLSSEDLPTFGRPTKATDANATA